MENIIVLDVQGFQYKKSQFLCKELAFTCGETPHYYLFKFPLRKDMLSGDFQKQVYWLEKNLHGLEWDSENGELYEHMEKFLKGHIDSKYTIYVKGMQKVLWLKNFLSNRIIDMEKMKCPRLSELRKQNKNIVRQCDNHNNANLQCASENVNLLTKWLESALSPPPTESDERITYPTQIN